MTRVIWWIRRDLRLIDNQALTAAIQSGEQVIPVFIIDPRLTESRKLPEKRVNFLWGGLQALDESLNQKGSRLIVRRGDPSNELFRLVEETGATSIFAEKDTSPFAKRRDQAIARYLPLKLTPGLTIIPPGSVLKADGNPYKIFTPFSKSWRVLMGSNPQQILPAPERINTPREINSLTIPQAAETHLFPPGENEAQSRLRAFVSGKHARIYQYADKRDRPDLSGTSEISPYLRFGMLSAREAARVANDAILHAPDEQSHQAAETWLNELIWREFYIAILHHFPNVLKESFRADLRGIPWCNDETDFNAWKAGLTGYPFVDAAMRQLAQTGWMHNRGRMIVASFLVKDLLIDWRWGERWFMQKLIDGDPAANNGGWQWSASTGTDAAPYFRIFNPILQGKKFDPYGDYVRHWVPELENIPQRYIHTPWEIPAHLQNQIGIHLGVKYPLPIIDHRLASERTIEAYRLAKN